MEIENGIIDNPTFIELASTKQDSFYIYIYYWSYLQIEFPIHVNAFLG